MFHWQKRLTEGVLGKTDEGTNLNYEVLEGKVPAADIIASADTLPFMADYRLIVLNDTGLFEAGRKDDSEMMAKYIPDIPESTVLVFVESNVDKRGRPFKRVKEAGFVAEAETPKEAELADWAVKLVNSRGKTLGKAAAYHLMRTVTNDMQLLFNELEKLISYAGANQEITIADIDALCAKSLEVKVFDLMKAVGLGQVKVAAMLYKGLIAMKESPLMILAMIARQYRFYLQCSELVKLGLQQKDIASKLALHPFAVKEFVAGSKGLEPATMIKALKMCLNSDYSIKTGEMADIAAVELLIIQLCEFRSKNAQYNV